MVILKDTDLEEKASFSIKGINVLAFFSVIFVFTFFIFILLFGFTPLRALLPASSNHISDDRTTELAYKADSLEKVLKAREVYVQNIKNILKGNVGDTMNRADNIKDLEVKSKDINLKPSTKEDSLLKAEFEKQNTYDLLYGSNTGGNEFADYTFFPPLKGILTSKYNEAEGHYAVDVVGPENVGIKAVLDGTVIFSEWSVSTGYVIMLQHSNNLVSVYKHNSELLKKVGNFVKAGEVIGIIGESGELSTGPHLHFELWHNGKPLNPEKYINF